MAIIMAAIISGENGKMWHISSILSIEISTGMREEKAETQRNGGGIEE